VIQFETAAGRVDLGSDFSEQSQRSLRLTNILRTVENAGATCPTVPLPRSLHHLALVGRQAFRPRLSALGCPSFDSATAAGFLTRSGSLRVQRGSIHLFPMGSSTTERAKRFGSRERLDLLAREVLVRLCQRMTCEEKARLVEAHHLKALSYARASRVLNRKRGTVPAPEYAQLQDAAERARIQSEEAHRAIQQHIADHGC
jgi:hypothetical protein